MAEDFWTYRTNDQELLDAVRRFLGFGALTVFDPKCEPDDRVIERYERWLGYWYSLRKGHKLSLEEVAEICGVECDAVFDGSSYVIRIKPYLGGGI